ncbi:CrcB family protein [Microbacterium sp. NC79]|uniref:CrcB family protein n=1 Tax=Microbacterium sp. NC79 TaxID=2851009 RepID=UPI001C2C34A5|nr:CrcB family protein [Microbacterium sp. NC79]MBV0893764.1 CrcB family protein [Microbacterium sp. NC79]
MTSSAPRSRARDMGLVFLGGTLGTAARLIVMLLVGDAAGLVTVNLAGAFLLGIVTAVLTRSPSARHRRAHLLLGTGALGGFTTYSALALSATDLAGLLMACIVAIAGVAAAALGFGVGGIRTRWRRSSDG